WKRAGVEQQQGDVTAEPEADPVGRHWWRSRGGTHDESVVKEFELGFRIGEMGKALEEVLVEGGFSRRREKYGTEDSGETSLTLGGLKNAKEKRKR
uniref:G-patch domain-containing protein n=1 Tax=Steinernema glaseri TaxID=37863 RepID=A0A1I8ATG0_9BILA